MDPVINYASNRRPHLLAAMVVAALRSLPHQRGTLRGSTESEAKKTIDTAANKVLDQMVEGQVEANFFWSLGGQMMAQVGMGIAMAMLNELYAKLCSKRNSSKEEKTNMSSQSATGGADAGTKGPWQNITTRE